MRRWSLVSTLEVELEAVRLPPMLGEGSVPVRDCFEDCEVTDGFDARGTPVFAPVRGGPVRAEGFVDETGWAYFELSSSESVCVAALSSDASSLSTKLCTMDETSSFSSLDIMVGDT